VQHTLKPLCDLNDAPNVPGRARQIPSSTCKRQVALKEVGAAKATPTLREETQASAFPGERDALATFYTLWNAQKFRADIH
jgi:hypothetical protein